MMTVAELERKKELDDLKTMMDSAAGRRLINRIMVECGIYQTSFSYESHVMAFNEGKRSVGLKLLADVMEVAPKKYTIMLYEAKENKESFISRLEKEREDQENE